MRQITRSGEEVLVFCSEEEREDYFEQSRRRTDREHTEELADLLRGYQVGAQKAREHYGRARVSLDSQRARSLLESEVSRDLAS